LQLWGELAESSAIPLTRRAAVVAAVVGRLEDKSTFVRKQVCITPLFFLLTVVPTTLNLLRHRF
jgi:hypothetical protein